jgi:hypothetical protein
MMLGLKSQRPAATGITGHPSGFGAGAGGAWGSRLKKDQAMELFALLDTGGEER